VVFTVISLDSIINLVSTKFLDENFFVGLVRCTGYR
jgi:hypothetical protein